MAKIVLAKGKETNMPTEKSEGIVYITTDTGKMFLDTSDSERKQIYGGTLTIGNYSYDGTQDINVPVYDGVYKSEVVNL